MYLSRDDDDGDDFLFILQKIVYNTNNHLIIQSFIVWQSSSSSSLTISNRDRHHHSYSILSLHTTLRRDRNEEWARLIMLNLWILVNDKTPSLIYVPRLNVSTFSMLTCESLARQFFFLNFVLISLVSHSLTHLIKLSLEVILRLWQGNKLFNAAGFEFKFTLIVAWVEFEDSIVWGYSGWMMMMSVELVRAHTKNFLI
jgi:hypothetical protein